MDHGVAVRLPGVPLLLALALAFTACAGKDPPRFRAESPAGSGNWVDAGAEPAWVAAPPRK
ncbi:MAG: hypothetical protein HUU06_01905, partial [Planctomycetaceae bacterium]|nr:hypothetical protein [Planctomycetaceae bacterium]